MKYVCPSSSSSKNYIVTLNHAGGATWCTCIGYKFNHNCKHAKAVEENPKAYKVYELSVDINKVIAESVRANKGGPGKKKVLLKRVAHTSFVKPMLAKVGDRKLIEDLMRRYKMYVEKKYNGHRMEIAVQEGMVRAWARSGKDRTKDLPAKLVKELAQLPNVLLDGELCIGDKGKSWNVTDLDFADERIFCCFDMIQLEGHDVTAEPYIERRKLLKEMFGRFSFKYAIRAAAKRVRSWDEIMETFEEITADGGEGVIVKRGNAPYQIGVRSEDFLKIKTQGSAVLKITGFKPGKSGPYSVTLLVDKQGNNAKVRTPTIKMRKRVAANPKWFIGQDLRIDYMERTPDGGYFQPRWDRLEKE